MSLLDDLIEAYNENEPLDKLMGAVQKSLVNGDKELAKQCFDVSMSLSQEPEVRSFILEVFAASRSGSNDLVFQVINHFLSTNNSELVFAAIAGAWDLPWEYRCKVYYKVLELPYSGDNHHAREAFIREFKDIQDEGSGI